MEETIQNGQKPYRLPLLLWAILMTMKVNKDLLLCMTAMSEETVMDAEQMKNCWIKEL